MLKDLGIAFEGAKESKASIPLGDHAKQLYEKVCKSGNERKDFSVVYDLLLNNKLW